ISSRNWRVSTVCTVGFIIITSYSGQAYFLLRPVPDSRTISLCLIKLSPLFIRKLAIQNQIRPAFQRFLDRFAPTPFFNLGVVPVQQNLGSFQPAKLRRSGVVRMIQQAADKRFALG